jgi:hypothetical protein
VCVAPGRVTVHLHHSTHARASAATTNMLAAVHTTTAGLDAVRNAALETAFRVKLNGSHNRFRILLMQVAFVLLQVPHRSMDANERPQ